MRTTSKFGNHVVYTHFDKYGNPLYIGCSISVMRRINELRKASWFKTIAWVKLDHFNSRAEAWAAEAKLIREQRPKYNVHHNLGR